jgi:hypothetical protein
VFDVDNQLFLIVSMFVYQLQALKPEGGMLHVHENVAVADRVKWVEEQLLPSLQSLARQSPDPVKRSFQVFCFDD